MLIYKKKINLIFYVITVVRDIRLLTKYDLDISNNLQNKKFTTKETKAKVVSKGFFGYNF